MKKITYIVCILVMTSCSLWQAKHREGVAVELNGHTLTYEQLDEITRSAQTGEDSTTMVNAYIYQWATDILEYDEAKDRASAELEQLVEDYRRTLYIHEYEQKLVSRHQPKQWPDSVVERVYEKQKEHLVLSESLVEGILLIVPKGAPQLGNLKNWLSHLNDVNIEKIEKYAFQYATGYEYFPNQWRTSTQVILHLPLETNILDEQLSKHNQITVEDSTSVYLLQITDKRLRGDVMPLEYARESINQLLQNEWRMAFLKNERQQLYDNAIRYDKLKRYDK